MAPPSRRSLRRRALILLGVLLLAAGIAMSVVSACVRRAATAQPTRPADAIIVLGAGSSGGQPKPVYRARLDHGLTLFEAGLAPNIIVTEKAPAAQTAREYLIARGVPEHAVLLEDRSRTTSENLLYAEQVMQEHGCQTAIVVSCGSHLFRALRMSHDLGIAAQGAAAPGTPAERTALKRFKFTFSEARKYLTYRLLGI